jgi:CelD/BcsL family acetyltransferase involved in cellulose biosynthesis
LTARIEPLTPAAARDRWSTLAQASGNVFATPEWIECWGRHLARQEDLLLLGCHAADELIGIVPLAVTGRRPLRVARFQGHGVGDQLGPICAPADRAALAAALRSALRADDLPFDVLLGERLEADGEWAGRLGERVLRTESNPIVRTDARTWDDYLAGKSSNLRSQLRRKERRLVREHGMEFRLADDAARLGEDMQALFDLHEQRWTAGESVAFTRQRERFHRDFAAMALERGWLRLWFLEIDGRPVAAWHGFRYAGVEWFYQSGRDPDWDRYSVGLVLLAHTIRSAIEDGVGEYRLLRGGEQYKSRFATEDPGLETLVVPLGMAGRAAAALARGFFAVPQRYRARVRRTARRFRHRAASLPAD